MIQCQCQAQGKKCSTEACGYRKQHLSFTTFCNCHGGQDCLNPFSKAREIVQSGEIVQSAEEGTETDDIESNHPDNSDDGIEQDNEP